MIDINLFKTQNAISDIRVVDIASLEFIENKGFPYAILIIKVLPPEYIAKLNANDKTDYSIFIEYEKETDRLADELTLLIQEAGYKAISQSENAIDLRNEYNEKTKQTMLPHKKIAVLSGLGWIGKNNLLVNEHYGSAFSMCSVLTDMPLDARQPAITLPRCGKCSLCVAICPVHALHGTTWEIGLDRDLIIDVYKCVTCLKCMAGCTYSRDYAKQ